MPQQSEERKQRTQLGKDHKAMLKEINTAIDDYSKLLTRVAGLKPRHSLNIDGQRIGRLEVKNLKNKLKRKVDSLHAVYTEALRRKPIKRSTQAQRNPVRVIPAFVNFVNDVKWGSAYRYLSGRGQKMEFVNEGNLGDKLELTKGGISSRLIVRALLFQYIKDQGLNIVDEGKPGHVRLDAKLQKYFKTQLTAMGPVDLNRFMIVKVQTLATKLIVPKEDLDEEAESQLKAADLKLSLEEENTLVRDTREYHRFQDKKRRAAARPTSPKKPASPKARKPRTPRT